jgi:hypothetical protein
MKKSLLLLLCIVTFVFWQCANKTSQKDTSSAKEDTTQNISEDVGDFKEDSEDAEDKQDTIDPYQSKDILCYRSAKIDKMVLANKGTKKPKEDEMDWEMNFDFLTEKEFNQLNIKEHLYYAFCFPEMSTQICAMYMPDKNKDKKIQLFLPFPEDVRVLSERQSNKLKENKDSVVVYLNQCIDNAKTLDTEFKSNLTEVDAYLCIPNLIARYKKASKKDNELLTTLVMLMRNSDYAPLTESAMIQKAYESSTHEGQIPSIPANEENIKKIIGWAEAYYQSKKVK